MVKYLEIEVIEASPVALQTSRATFSSGTLWGCEWPAAANVISGDLAAGDTDGRFSVVVTAAVYDHHGERLDAHVTRLRQRLVDNDIGLLETQWIHLTAETANAIKIWISAANINAGHVFRGIRGEAEISNSLCESRIARIYKTLARRAGLSEQIIQGISGHSMRVGGAQDLLQCGATLPQIMVKGGWGKTDTVMRYVDRIRPII